MMRVDRALCTENASKMRRVYFLWIYAFLVMYACFVCMFGFVLCDFDLSAFDSASN